MQTIRNKDLIHPSMLWHFQGFREQKTFCTKHNVVYPNIPSAPRPVTHDDSPPIRKPPRQWTLHEEETTSNSPEDEAFPSCSNMHPDFQEQTVLYLISQSELNDLVRDFKLSKIQADLLVSHLQGRNLLQQCVKVSYRKSQYSLSSFIS
jgi:hypothetical protein